MLILKVETYFAQNETTLIGDIKKMSQITKFTKKNILRMKPSISQKRDPRKQKMNLTNPVISRNMKPLK